MSTSQIQHLISMINQISSNNNYKKSDEETASFVANHIRSFWARSMKEQILQYAAEDGSELSNASRIALTQL
ncbi:MAG: formate dehydrogenase subunit delta [Colwellia sp.]|nr:formate dehydrogenase subunit delta [Colwellia sp.]